MHRWRQFSLVLHIGMHNPQVNCKAMKGNQIIVLTLE
jgi:hypothetical protein